ncbi:PDDEXK-like family protein [Sediminibacterium salmoneum]|uniref:PDDEXK-like family protein n=1 Tax=Sediminibacterium salmoneum TaxID=426421 RepID=UPI00047C1106|nr:PD-(D/E)XK nuclease family protein [Sediminibacterium salmoneum]
MKTERENKSSLIDAKNLLREVAAINKKYEGIETITGEKYNVFKILKVDTSEVRLHSSFIASLLDPNGTHGQGSAFLRLFLDFCQVKIDNLFHLDGSSVNVEVTRKNGRIDIVVKLPNGQIIVIENKIYAIDQPQQLVRYKLNYPDCYLIYLTLSGDDPGENSITNLDSNTSLEKGKDFITISYRDEILNWLIECRKEATNHPILRETISQYINLIKYLTFQNMSNQNKQEIIDSIINNSDNLDAAQNIYSLWSDVKLTITGNLKEEIVKVANELGLVMDCDSSQFGKPGSSFWFYKNTWDVCFSFYFEKDAEKLSFGIDLSDSDHDISNALKNKINGMLSNLDFGQVYKNENWIYVADFKVWRDTAWKNKVAVIPAEIKKTILKMQDDLKDVLK